MERYADLSGRSGVAAYEIGDDYICSGARMLISLSWRWEFRHTGRGDRAPTHACADAVPMSCFPKLVFFATKQVYLPEHPRNSWAASSIR
jgi:hypothetical protein